MNTGWAHAAPVARVMAEIAAKWAVVGIAFPSSRLP
jgi:hypothetical protein